MKLKLIDKFYRFILSLHIGQFLLCPCKFCIECQLCWHIYTDNSVSHRSIKIEAKQLDLSPLAGIWIGQVWVVLYLLGVPLCSCLWMHKSDMWKANRLSPPADSNFPSNFSNIYGNIFILSCPEFFLLTCLFLFLDCAPGAVRETWWIFEWIKENCVVIVMYIFILRFFFWFEYLVGCHSVSTQ